MLAHIRPALVILVVLTAVTGLAYPLAMTGLAGLVFPHQAAGSLIERGGVVIGSELIGQSFTSERYFQGRLSATSMADPADASKTVPAPYNAANSSGSNLGPTSATLIERVKGDVATRQADNPGAPVPSDLVTTSASGLDPHVTPEAAMFQVARVARTRNLPVEQVRRLVADHVEGRTAGILGEPRVNVLALNLALDAAMR